MCLSKIHPEHNCVVVAAHRISREDTDCDRLNNILGLECHSGHVVYRHDEHQVHPTDFHP